MAEIWNQARIEQYITDEIEESQTLDYKAAGALSKADSKKREITKDVSAMANAAGGLIVYGIAEHKDKTKKHIPEKINPINRSDFSKEWLEHIISNIQPKIDDIIIHSVSIDTSATDVVYVIEIPQSYTAHQAMDKRYYKRYNFESVAMSDYEVRDVMSRGQHPRVELEFVIFITQEEMETGENHTLHFPLDLDLLMQGQQSEPAKREFVTQYSLNVSVFNSGAAYAQYVNIFLEIPDMLRPREAADDMLQTLSIEKRLSYEKEGILYSLHQDDNSTRDIIGVDTSNINIPIYNYGSVRYEPILPGLYYRNLDEVYLHRDFESYSLEGLHINWKVFADNAPPHEGMIAVQDIKVIDKR